MKSSNHLSIKHIIELFKESEQNKLLILTLSGKVVFANENMSQYVNDSIHKSFINPTIQSLLIKKTDGLIFKGYFTLGDLHSNENKSFKGVAIRENSLIIIRMETDSTKNQMLNTDLIKLFQENTNLQRDLIKEKKLTEEQLEKIKILNDEKNKFLGIAAHDLRNPIGLIYSYTDLLIDDSDVMDNPILMEQIKVIRERSEFALSLINDLLDVSKIESGKLDLNIKNNDLKKLIIRTADNLSFFKEKRQIKIAFEFSEGEYILAFDKNKIEQVISNLITNALNYSESHTTITIRTRFDAHMVFISVNDMGPGIPTQMLDTIFQPFCVSSNKPKGHQKSTGLGLTIVKRVLEAHGGTIIAENRPEGGASFRFSLPVM
ncbi:MAG: HAMP domain-containing histidine kinase [Bacteroidales bacterium]|nr:HAMP domain-containing histidine kinase [Bacteroidales bacterium]